MFRSKNFRARIWGSLLATLFFFVFVSQSIVHAEQGNLEFGDFPARGPAWQYPEHINNIEYMPDWEAADVRDILQRGSNFAGSAAFITMQCGTGCALGTIYDSHTDVWYDVLFSVFRDFDADPEDLLFEFKPDSTLLVARGWRDDLDFGTFLYHWTGFELVAVLDPSKPDSRSHRDEIAQGNSLLDRGDEETALLHYLRALAKARSVSERVTALASIGIVHRDMGELYAARRYISRVLDLRPQNEWAQEVLASLPIGDPASQENVSSLSSAASEQPHENEDAVSSAFAQFSASDDTPAAAAFDVVPGQLGLTCQPVRRVASNRGAGLSRVMPLRNGIALVWEDLDRPLGQGSISQRAYQIAVDQGGDWQIVEQTGGHAGGSVTERDITVNAVQYHRMPDGTAVFPIYLDRPSQRFAGTNSTMDIGFLDAATGELRQEDVFGDARFTALLAAQTLDSGDLIVIYKRQLAGHGRSTSGEGPAIFERTRDHQSGDWSIERPVLPPDYPYGTVAPRAFIAPDGQRIVAWENRERTWDDAAQGTGSGMATVYVDSIVYDPANDTWSQIVTVDNHHNIAPHSPSVLISPDGKNLVWWIRRGPMEIRVQEIAPNGHVVHDPVVLAEGIDINLPHGGHIVGLPQAVADTNGNITIAFQRAAGGAASSLKYLRYDSASKSWSGPARLFPDDTRRMQIANLVTTSRGDPIIGMSMPGASVGDGQGGGFVLALSRFDKTNGEWTSPVKLEASGEAHSEPLEVALTISPDNRLFASWNRRGDEAVQRDLFTVTCLPG